MAKKETLEVAVQQPAQPPATLYNMVAYMKALASMEEVPTDLEAAFEAECRTALTATAEKIDAVHSIMFRFAALARSAEGAAAGYQSAIADELEREQKRAARYVSKLESLRRMVMEVGVMRGLYVGDGDKRKPAPLQGNVATFQFDLMPACIAEEGFDEALVPVEFKKTIVTWEGTYQEYLSTLVEVSKGSDTTGVFRSSPERCTDVLLEAKRATTSFKVDRKALLAALKEPCPVCGGLGVNAVPDVDSQPCSKCSGTGKRKVPGAKLETGRLKLVVK